MRFERSAESADWAWAIGGIGRLVYDSFLRAKNSGVYFA
jgi:hypothetical protein